MPGRAAEPGRVVSAPRVCCAPTSHARQVLAYAGRAISAAPAVGYSRKHNAEQRTADRGRVRRRASERRNGLGALNRKQKHANRSQGAAAAGVGHRSDVGELAQKGRRAPSSRDENLIDVETDKVVLELPAPARRRAGRDRRGGWLDRYVRRCDRRHRHRGERRARGAAHRPRPRHPPPQPHSRLRHRLGQCQRRHAPRDLAASRCRPHAR